MNSFENYNAAIAKNFRHNFIFNSLDGIAFWFGASFYSPSIILPVFITHFTHNPLILALIPFISTAGYLVPQLFTSHWVERAPVKKIFPVKYGFFLERIPIALLVPSTLLLSIRYPALAVVTTLLLFSWYTVGAGMILVGWQDMIAKIIPTDKRGRFFGVTNFLGNGSGILGAALVTWLLGKFVFPIGYVWAFGLGAALNFLSWWFLSQVREPPDPEIKIQTTFLDYYKKIPQLLKANPNFSRYLVSQMIVAVSAMGNGFLIVYAVQHWSLLDSQAAGYTVLFMAGQAIANPLLGWLADKKGHKLILEISLVLNIASLVAAILAPSPFWFYSIFFFRGVTMAGNFLAGISIVMEFCTPSDRPTYIGLANTLPGIAGGVAPLLGGWLALQAGYPWLFAVSAVVGLAGFFMLRWFVREPRFHNTLAPLGESKPEIAA
jgi:MFS family permease